jgi:erythronate-4-phosphate dehydrogenase
MKKLRIVADAHIPYLYGVLEPYARVEYLHASGISRRHLSDADALIIRTRTRCGHDLLEGTPVQFIATATIGYDHMDADYLRSRGIAWSHAPGCNAGSVKQYVASALATWRITAGVSLPGLTIGIIGAGHVGSQVAELSGILGMKTLLNDPPRATAEGSDGFCDLDELLENSDIVTLHVPLQHHSPFGTYHMANQAFFGRMKRKPLLINTSRGEVVETPSLISALDSGKISGFIADVWEDEPRVNLKALSRAFLATPHIAGYSAEGKANGTAACVRALSRHFGLGIDNWVPGGLPEPGHPIIRLRSTGKTPEELLCEAMLLTYDIKIDDRSFRAAPGDFEKLRDHYPARREPGAFRIELNPENAEMMGILEQAGFFRTY